NTSTAIRAAMSGAHTSGMQVLASQDEALYQTIFDAQQKSDWKTADRAISHLGDKRLMGHVLADRYERHPASPRELQAWLSSYNDLPEAADVYEKARNSAKNTHISSSDLASRWTGNDGYGASAGFRIEGSDKASPAARTFAAKLNRALRRND